MEFVSEGCRALTGYDREALLNGDVSWGPDLLQSEDRQRLWETVQAALDDREPFDVTYQIQTADGEYRWVWEQGRGVFEDDELVALEGIILDVDQTMDRRTRLETRATRHEELLKTLPTALVVADASERTVVDCNATAASLFEMSRADLVESSLSTLFPPETPALRRPDSVDSTLDGQPVSIETAEGRERVVGVSTNTVAVRDRTLVQILLDPSAADDGNSRASAAGQQRDQAAELERYRTLVENVGDSMYVLDTDGMITMTNQAMADHLGYDREDLVGSHASRFMPEEDVETGSAVIRRLLTSEETWGSFEMETIHADGSRSLNEDKVAALTDDDGEYVGSVGVIRDISERKQRERELRRYETIIQAVGDPVYALDTDGRFLFVNEAASDALGYEADELVGTRASRLMTEESYKKSIDHLERLLSSEDISYLTFEVDLITKDGRHIPTENHMAVLVDGAEFQGTAGVIRDISARKRREKRLEEFASVVSHDLQSPLNVISGRADLAVETGDLGHVEAIQNAADRMDSLIDDLLKLAREGRTVGEREPTPLSGVVSTAWEQVQSPAATLSVAVEQTIEADPDRLRELFSNLFRNAVEHGGEDVAVTVGGLDEHSGFYVADDGSGIDPERRQRIFEHGHTTNDEGTGLGLSIVENIVEAHGWSIRATESAAGGARFEILTG
jgi:PAS domain S-box-containing protein